MKQRIMLVAILGLLALSLAAPVFAQEGAAAAGGGNEAKAQLFKWSIIAGGASLGFAAAICALSQGISITAACNGIARNPGASPQIRFVLIFGLVLIESLAIYVLLINLIIFFVKWNSYPGV